jgi:hypothetical protein
VSKPNPHQKQNDCNFFEQVTEDISRASTKECDECIKKGTRWAALRVCLSCGQLGWRDSSLGRQATQHFIETDHHPVMIALPNKA